MDDVSKTVRRHFMLRLGLPEQAAMGLVETSRASLARSLAELEKALAARDRVKTGYWAHHIKGNLLNTGLTHLAEHAQAIEIAVAQGSGALEPDLGQEGALRIRAGLRPFLDGQ